MTACKSPDPDEIAKEVAMRFKYYDNMPNHYTSENEIEGYCSDYAILFSLKTGANLVIQNQEEKLNIPDGVYRITGKVSKKLENEIRSGIPKNSRSGWIGPFRFNGTWPLSLYHPIVGTYKIKLIKKRTATFHFGVYMIGGKPHVWNELNGVIYDICSADLWNTPFKGIDTY